MAPSGLSGIGDATLGTHFASYLLDPSLENRKSMDPAPSVELAMDVVV